MPWIGSAGVGTIVSFHAHPDDESIGTAGTLARAVAAGHRVVLVFATRGELGEPVPGVLADGEQLRAAALGGVLRRGAGARRAPRRVPRLHRLRDDGRADQRRPVLLLAGRVEHAARRLAVILDEEEPDVLTVYDDIGGYGHPDHIQVHRVGMRAQRS